MATLLLRLGGPMQSWGTQSRFSVRDTGREPSKSGVIGLLCAALGRQRSEPVSDLDGLLMGVRVDREGAMKMDFHTALDVARASGKGTKGCELSKRYYLADADFLVGLQGETRLLRGLHDTLRGPRWQVFLGRKSFVPGRPLWVPDGLREEALKKALQAYPWLARTDGERKAKLRELEGGEVRLRLAIEVPFKKVADFPEKRPLDVRSDRLLSDFADRRYGTRHVATYFMPLRPDMVKLEEEVYPCTSQG